MAERMGMVEGWGWQRDENGRGHRERRGEAEPRLKPRRGLGLPRRCLADARYLLTATTTPAATIHAWRRVPSRGAVPPPDGAAPQAPGQGGRAQTRARHRVCRRRPVPGTCPAGPAAAPTRGWRSSRYLRPQWPRAALGRSPTSRSRTGRRGSETDQKHHPQLQPAAPSHRRPLQLDASPPAPLPSSRPCLQPWDSAARRLWRPCPRPSTRTCSRTAGTRKSRAPRSRAKLSVPPPLPLLHPPLGRHPPPLAALC